MKVEYTQCDWDECDKRYEEGALGWLSVAREGIVLLAYGEAPLPMDYDFCSMKHLKLWAKEQEA